RRPLRTRLRRSRVPQCWRRSPAARHAARGNRLESCGNRSPRLPVPTPEPSRRCNDAHGGDRARIAGGDAMKRDKVVELFTRLRELDPQPTTELDYSTPFELLVAVILSAQATDVGVNKATRKLFPVANTPQAMLVLGEEGLKRHIATIGLFNAK